MEISLIDAKATARCLSRLIKKHERISIAVAWGGLIPLAETLLDNVEKFDSVLIGVDFCASDPDLIDRLVGVPNAFVARSSIGCFHPKVFYFETGETAEAVVGSANFTNGGVGKNTEAGVHLKGKINEPIFIQIRDQMESYRQLAVSITQEWADSYRRMVKRNGQSRPGHPTFQNDEKKWAAFTSELATMQWREFAELAQLDVYHDFNKRMSLVRTIQHMFVREPSLTQLSNTEVKGIAGVLGRKESGEAGLDNLEWGWFGSMGAAGTFAELIGAQDRALLSSLDVIPRNGLISKDQFDAYVDAFTAAFSGMLRTARLAPATRLLAMKRPDFFVCVNKGNTKGLAEALSFAPTTIKLENYWERIIEPIQQAPWYNEPRSAGRNMELWDARAAMVDAIYYAPDTDG